MRPDPAQFAGFEHKDDPQAWNGYAYGRNNPLLYTDPDGLNHLVCDKDGKNCADLSDPQYDQFRKDNPNLRVTKDENGEPRVPIPPLRHALSQFQYSREMVIVVFGHKIQMVHKSHRHL